MVQILGWFGAEAGPRLAAKTFQRLRVVGQVLGQELQRDWPTEFSVLSLVHHTHPAAAEPFDDPVMGDGFANHGHWAGRLSGMLGDAARQVKLCFPLCQ
jgi:hypothetical protein